VEVLGSLTATPTVCVSFIATPTVCVSLTATPMVCGEKWTKRAGGVGGTQPQPPDILKLDEFVFPDQVSFRQRRDLIFVQKY
jgi:hypothetical protein